jgi:hypothetical protein
MVTNRDRIIKIVNEIRHTIFISSVHNNMVIEPKKTEFFERCKGFVNCAVIKTTGDGDCLFHAISLSIFGNEERTDDIKICTVFILLEYQKFFTSFLAADYGCSFERLVRKTATKSVWGSSIHLSALSILCLRPIYSYPSNIYSLSANPANCKASPIMLHYGNINDTTQGIANHYMAILGKYPDQTRTFMPPYASLTDNLPFNLGLVNLY